MAADMSPLANFAPHGARSAFDAISMLVVMALATFVEALPHLIQLVGLGVVILTAAEKLIALGWIRNPKRPRKEQSDDPR
ncbi:hypothetical protein [Novosphingobium humi]|uniref:Uncharacterized protein n=1 Tax=Novosphingobium humi TaxID=2282397 RepID=A0ABY7TSV4_9SPHN|nr:hypothetical protein [Novosphingobium humi]WCT76294.1 hypothetical protein PQ457_10060 [Novosphingobium humi]WJS97243.1 hypothetical protein NYQ05_08665 [Novosphingobium humi]